MASLVASHVGSITRLKSRWWVTSQSLQGPMRRNLPPSSLPWLLARFSSSQAGELRVLARYVKSHLGLSIGLLTRQKPASFSRKGEEDKESQIERKREDMSPRWKPCLHNPVSEEPSHCCCCIFRSPELVSAIHTRGVGIT